MQLTNPGAVIENTIRYRILKQLFKEIGHVDVLLDLGCGPRPYYAIYAPNCSKSIGADLQDSPFPKKNIDLYCSATQIPLENSSIDVVLSTEVMHDMPEPREMLKEIFRILKPNGKVILTTPFVVPTVDGIYDHYRYTEQGLRYLFTKEGFVVKQIIPVSDVIGACFTLYIKPWLRFWNTLAKISHLKPVYSNYNPFFLITITLPQAIYLWTAKLPLLKSLYRKFSYGAIGYVSVAVKSS